MKLWWIRVIVAAAVLGLGVGSALAEEGGAPADDDKAQDEAVAEAEAEPIATEPAPVETGSAASEEAADASVAATGEEEEEEDKGWGVGLSTGLSVGIGTFVSDEYTRRSRVRYSVGANGSYTIPVIDVAVSLATGFSQWLTEAGGSQTVQEFRWQDTLIGFSRAIYTIPVIDLALTGGLDFTVPTSRYSIESGLYTSISPSLAMSTSLGPVGLSYSIAYYHNFYEYTSPTFDSTEVDILSRSGGNEILGSNVVALDGVLPEFGVSNQFGVSYTFLEDFRLRLGFGFNDGWTFDNGTITADDELTPDEAEIGRGHSQGTNGSFSFSYTPWKYINLSLSMTSSQPWKTADNKGYRFPFIDLEGPSDNRTSFGFTVAGNY